MTKTSKAAVVLYWHMHQPDYRDATTREYYFPWTYLHGLKDYVDMVAHLEAVPTAKAVFNFSPVLLNQIDDYATNLSAWETDDIPIRDEILAALVAEQLPEPGSPSFMTLAHKCLRANRQRMIERFPVYRWLADTLDEVKDNALLARYLSPNFMSDLLVWYHLAWMGETVRRENSLVQALQTKGDGFTLEDRKALLALIRELLAGIIPRYKNLLAQGRIEISINPYSHPILPLLQSFNSAREAMPEVTLPNQDYMGGWERTLWQLDKGLETYARFFGNRPSGCWPSEGGLSEQTLVALQRKGFRWTASGDSVLGNSVASPNTIRGHQELINDPQYSYQPFQFAGIPVTCFFRDDALSDTIGFHYSQWNAEDAVGDLIHRLENIVEQAPPDKEPIIPIIMDGENAWEYFSENAYEFLSTLYQRLSNHTHLRLTTFEQWLDRPQRITQLPRLTAGSWVYGSFSTWIGDNDKNTAWWMLVQAKEQFDVAKLKPHLFTANAWLLIEEQLALCESSDWFWWFGDYNPAESVRDFDYLYRKHLINLYQLLEVEPPAYLYEVIGTGKGDPASGGVMRKGHQGG